MHATTQLIDNGFDQLPEKQVIEFRFIGPQNILSCFSTPLMNDACEEIDSPEPHELPRGTEVSDNNR